MQSDAAIQEDTLAWLLEPDDPGVRYLALRDLVGLPGDDPQLRAARAAAHREGPIAEVLAQMSEPGYWVKPGTGYGPKYQSTVWAVTLLAQLGGAISEDARIERACRYVLDNTLLPGGQFTATSGPGGTIDCLQGNLCAALVALGCSDPRLKSAYDWMARTVTGEGIAPASDTKAAMRYYAYKCGPNFACGANNRLPCAWGATKVMLAFANAPAQWRDANMQRAIQMGVDFLLGVDPAAAQYPTGYSEKPSGNWWKFGFPVFYVTDILQIVEALCGLGYARDPRLANALALIRAKQDAQGRWLQEYPYGAKTWSNFGGKGKPNKWVTLRALRVLKAA